MPRDLEKRLMRKTKAELRKILRQYGKEANIKLKMLKETGKWERMPLPTRNVVETWIRQNRGRFFVAPRGRKKRVLVLYIRQAMAFLGIPVPADEDEEIDEDVAEIADKFSAWYDPSEFWQIYWDMVDSDSPEKRQMFWDKAHEIAAESQSRDEFYTNLQSGETWL